MSTHNSKGYPNGTATPDGETALGDWQAEHHCPTSALEPPNPDFSLNLASASAEKDKKIPDSRMPLGQDANAEIEEEEDVMPKIKPWRCGDPYQYLPEYGGDPWQTCHKLTQKHDKDMCDAWRDEIEKLLIFAGLFSAAVTAFTTQSYQLLQENPNDTSVKLLVRITAQLDIISRQNFTAPLIAPISQVPPPTAVSIRINIFWFLSLILSLTTVLIGILCMQWLREYQRESNLPNMETVALRQMRYEGLMQWKVSSIISGLPLLLQCSLILFFAGILDLLWSLSRAVAVPITVVIGLTVIFLVATTLLPNLQCLLAPDLNLNIAQCPYKSPQSLVIHWLGVTLNSLALRFVIWSSYKLQMRTVSGYLQGKEWVLLRLSNHMASWDKYDTMWRRRRDVGHDHAFALSWIADTFTESVDAVHTAYHCFRSLPVPGAIIFLKLMRRDIQVSDLECISEDNPLHADVRWAYALESLRYRGSGIISGFANHTSELYVRVRNTEATLNQYKVPLHPFDIYIKKVEVPDDIKLQILECFKLSVRRGRVSGASDDCWRDVRVFITHCVFHGSRHVPHLSPDVRWQLQGFNRFLKNLVKDNPATHGGCVLYASHLLRRCSRRRFARHISMFPEFLSTLEELVKILDQSIYKYGFPNDIPLWLPYSLDEWRELVDQYFKYSSQRLANGMHEISSGIPCREQGNLDVEKFTGLLESIARKV